MFTALSIIFGNLIPQTNVQKTMQNNGEEILALMDGKDGSDYFLASDSRLERYDSLTNKMISQFEFSTIENALAQKGVTLPAGSLLGCSLTYLTGLTEDYFVLYDLYGNFFKLKDDGVNLTLTDDYYLADKKTVIKGMDNVGEDVYVLANKSDASNFVQKWNASNFASGCVAERKLWYADRSAGADATVIKGLYGNDISVYQFAATEDALYLLRAGGNIVRIGLDFVDSYDEQGNPVDFFASAANYYETEYAHVYDEAYRLFFVDLVLGLTQDVHTEDEIRNATKDELIAWYGDRENGGKSQTTVQAKKTEANEYAQKQATQGFTAQYEWGVAYDKQKGEITVKNSGFNSAAYAIIEPGTSVAGMVYSIKNKTFYYANASDGYLYSVEKEDLDKAVFPGAFLADLGKKVEGISYTTKKFNDKVGNGLGYNEFANTLYVKFKNERTVDIIDINDKANCQVLYSFEGDFNIYSLSGDKNNETTHVLRQVGIVRLDGSENVVYYACSYNPNLFEQKTLIKTVFIVALVLAVVCVALCVWFAITLKNDRLMAKTKIIQRDLKKNKWIYASLIIFIAMLILFCYYEAIGAIAMSFFDYTQEEPAWIWNNFGHYLKIFNDDQFLKQVGNMLFFLVTDLFFCIVPPLVFAFLLSHIRYEKVSNWVRSLMFIPGIIPSIATMLIWREGIYGTDGVFNQILGVFGVKPIQWLLDASISRWSLIFMGFPFVGGYLIFYGGMMNIPKEYHEAGRLEGLGVVKEFISIDIPLIMPQIKYIFIMTFIESAQNYARTYILSASGSDTIVHVMYKQMSQQGNYGLSSAYATLIFVFLFAAVATNFKMQKKDAMGEDL